MGRALLIWCSNNSRAEAVLARVAIDSTVPLILVDSGNSWVSSSRISKSVPVIHRQFGPITKTEILQIVAEATSITQCSVLVLAPTSEYLLDFLSTENIPQIHTTSHSKFSYRELSSKYNMTKYFADKELLPVPNVIASPSRKETFVAKPKFNCEQGQTLKPIIVDSDESFSEFLKIQDKYFCQEFVSPPSYYWCGYRRKNGYIVSYFQKNLAQVSGGGSIIAAQLSDPPNAASLDCVLRTFLNDIAFEGPLMVEFRSDRMLFIELNPRFWGPVLLSTSLKQNPISEFFKDQFHIEPNLSFFRNFKGRYIVPSLFQNSFKIDYLSSTREEISQLQFFTNALKSEVAINLLGGAW